MSKPSTNTAILLTIFVTVFIDMLGISIVIPVIPTLFFEADSQFFDLSVSMERRSILYGVLVACFPLMQFFGAPILGALSDRYGRKPVLTVALIGTFLGYILFAYAILSHQLWLLFFSRMLPGFTGGNVAIVLSAIADISEAKDKARNFGLVGAAFGIGFILGPTIGGLLADDSILPWFNHATPFWFTAALTLFNVGLVHWRFPETLQNKRIIPLSLMTGLKNVATSFRIPELRVIFSVVLLLSLGFTFFTQFFSVKLIQEFDYREKDIGFLFGWIGIWLVFTQGYVVRQLSGRIKAEKVLLYSIPLLTFGLTLILVPEQSFWFFVITPLVALGQGVTSPHLTTVVSERAGTERQGEILGISQSMQSLGATLPPILAGYLNTLDGDYPIMASALLTFIACVVYAFLLKRT
ncbi:MAG: MFS transporter [Bacteroidota bacterium]